MVGDYRQRVFGCIGLHIGVQWCEIRVVPSGNRFLYTTYAQFRSKVEAKGIVTRLFDACHSSLCRAFEKHGKQVTL